jgi:photosystem II stability/assembly factor-like uncharacterized protein
MRLSICSLLCGLFAMAQGQWTTLINFNTAVPRAIHFSDVTHGYFAADGKLYKTADGGSSWQSAGFMGVDTLHQTFKMMRSIHTFNANEAIVCGVDMWTYSDMILRTQDGGQDWDTVHLGAFGTELNDLHFATNFIGTAVGNDGHIYRSVDGGYTWNFQPSGTSIDLHGVFFRDAFNGVAVGDQITLRTTDGGTNWVPTTVGVALIGIEALDATSWMASGADGTALLSEDGGATWQDRSLPLVSPELNRLSAFDANTVFVGADAQIYVTHDRGQIWEVFDVVTSGYLVDDIYVPASFGGVGYAVSVFGRIYKTTNASNPGYPIMQALRSSSITSAMRATRPNGNWTACW